MYRLGLSILDCNHLNLSQELPPLLPEVDFLHIDLMDNHFVDGLGIGINIVQNLYKTYKIPIDCHLMVEKPETLLPFLDSMKISITFHIETTNFPHRLIKKIQESGQEVGLAINPATKLPSISLMEEVDRLLIMSVEPGKGGQKFLLESTLSKLRKLEHLSFAKSIQLDGGVNLDSIKHIKGFKVNELVLGSYIFNRQSPESRLEAIRAVRQALL